MVTLFRMSGMEGVIAETEAEALPLLKDLLRDKSLGLLVVTEHIAQWGAEMIAKVRFSKSQLLIVEIPDEKGHIETGKSLSDYIREAVGIRI